MYSIYVQLALQCPLNPIVSKVTQYFLFPSRVFKLVLEVGAFVSHVAFEIHYTC